jgi:uncharacterized repeat protein (TIGR01451 family)
MRRVILAALVLAVGAVATGSASPSLEASQLTCKYGSKFVTKIVHGHKKRVKVCKKKPKPKPPPPTANLELTVQSTLDQVTAGNHVVLTLQAENEGPNVADDVTLTVDLPPGKIEAYGYGGSNESSGECDIQASATANHLECQFGTLRAEPEETLGLNEYAVLRIELEPDRAGDYTVSAKATASASTIDPNPADSSVAKSLRVLAGPAAADLGVAIESPSEPSSVPDGYTQTVTVTNAGPTEATDVLVTALVPQGATVVVPLLVNVDIASLLGTTCPPFFYGYLSTAIACIESVPSGATRTATLNISPSIHSPGTLTTDAVVSSYTRDSNLANNRASADVAVTPFVPAAGVDMRLAFDGAPKLTAGKQLVLPFRVSNLGLEDADDVAVEASITPPVTQLGLALQSDSEGVGCSSPDTGPIECQLSEIESDSRISGTMYAESIAAGSYTATVTITSPDLSAPLTKTIAFEVK